MKKKVFEQFHFDQLAECIGRLKEIAPNTPVMNRLMEKLQSETGIEIYDGIVNDFFDSQGGEIKVRGTKPFPYEVADYIIAQCQTIEGILLRERMEAQGIKLN